MYMNTLTLHMMIHLCDLILQSRKRRYFVLWSNGTFEYYSSASKRPQDYLKTVDLTYCEDMVAPITLQGRENIIRLTVQQGDKVHIRTYTCTCTVHVYTVHPSMCIAIQWLQTALHVTVYSVHVHLGVPTCMCYRFCLCPYSE